MDPGGKPLSGQETRPLKPASLDALRLLVAGPRPCSDFNAGVVDRLTRGPEPLAERTEGSNPFPKASAKRPKVPYPKITAVGSQRASQ